MLSKKVKNLVITATLVTSLSLQGIIGITNVHAQYPYPIKVEQSVVDNLSKLTLEDLNKIAKPAPKEAIFSETGTNKMLLHKLPFDNNIYYIENELGENKYKTFYKKLYIKGYDDPISAFVPTYIWDTKNGEVLDGGVKTLMMNESKYYEEYKNSLEGNSNQGNTEDNKGDNTEDNTPSNPTENTEDNMDNGSDGFNIKDLNIKRFNGKSRVDTALEVAKHLNKKDNIIIASGLNYPDALGASLLSEKLNAPILLSIKTQEDNKVISHISESVNVGGNVYILGGEGSVSKGLETTLKEKGYNTIRLNGNDRYETNVSILNHVQVTKGTPVFIVSGNNFPDALSVSGISAIRKYPILMVDKNTLNSKTEEYLKNLQPSKIYMIGSSYTISDNIENKIKSICDSTIERVYGKDRYDTSVKLYKSFITDKTNVVLASGKNFPDALSSTLLSVNNNTTTLLVGDLLKSEHTSIIKSCKNLYILGGEGSIKTSLIENIK